MSIKLMSLVFDADGMTPVHKLVMLALCDYAADDGTSIYPSLRTISKKTALKDSTVRKALRELRDPDGMNLLLVSAKSTNRFPNRYCVNVSALRSLSWVSPGNTQALSSSIQGVTTKHPRVLPGNTDPSIDPLVDPSINGISHPDFSSACARLKAAYPADYAQADPLLLEADEHPYRLHVRLATMPPDFTARLSDALREVNPRRNYRLTYQTNGTGRQSEQGAPKPAIAAPDPYAPDDTLTSILPGHSMMTPEQIWTAARGELQLEMSRATFDAWIKPTTLLSVNGTWKIATPDKHALVWLNNRLKSTIKRILSSIADQAVEPEFVFVEPRR